MAQENDIIGDRYRIITQIGLGGMSTVYLALDKTLNKQWAIKEIKNIDDPRKREVIVRSLVEEANLIKDFDHPAIPRIVDLIDDQNKLYVVMDYIEGETLTNRFRRQGPCSQKDVVDWGIQLCSVLDYLHRRNPPIVFADMKPSNVMVKPDGTVMLIDFGIAHRMGEDLGHLSYGTHGVFNLGTPGYGAPEQFAINKKLDTRSDVYSLGMTLHFLLTGSDPRQEVQPIRQYRPELSEGLEKVIDKAIEKDPDKRFQSCAEFAYALRHYQEKDRAHHRVLLLKWRSFLSAVIAALVCLVLGGGALIAENATRNNSFDYWMSLAEHELDDEQAEAYYLRASNLQPDSIKPYEGLLNRYRNDGKFTHQEATQFLESIQDHEISLKSRQIQWAQLSYDTGLMYWFYYQRPQSSSASSDSSSLQYERIRYAGQWMQDAAAVKNFSRQPQARVYADIASFNNKVVPQIVQGTDKGQFKIYFGKIQGLIDIASESRNEVMRFNVAQFVESVLSTYPRKFRADGISQQDMLNLVDHSVALARNTASTSTSGDEIKQNILRQENDAKQSIINGFIDSRKVGN